VQWPVNPPEVIMFAGAELMNPTGGRRAEAASSGWKRKRQISKKSPDAELNLKALVFPERMRR
jgi:hypothetical protein